MLFRSQHAVAVFGPVRKKARVLFEDSASDLALPLQKREVAMTACVSFELGDLPRHDQGLEHEVREEKSLNVEGQFVNGQLGAFLPSRDHDPVLYIDRNGTPTNIWSASNLVNYGSSDPLFNGNFGINGEIKGFGFNFVLIEIGRASCRERV